MKKDVLTINSTPFSLDEQNKKLIATGKTAFSIPLEKLIGEGKIWLVIHGVSFDLDPKTRLLSEVGNPTNVTRLDDLHQEGNRYIGRFVEGKNRIVKPAPERALTLSLDERVLLPKALLQREITQDFAEAFNSLSYKSQWNVVAGENGILQRMLGEKIDVKVLDTLFKADLESLVFMQADIPLNKIPITPIDHGRGGYEISIDKATMQHVPISSRDVEYPDKDVAIIKLDASFDPIGRARRDGVPELTYLKEHPVRMFDVATVINLSDTNFAEKVRRNQIEQQAHSPVEKEEQKQKGTRHKLG